MGAVIILVIGGLLFAMLIVPRQRELRRHQALSASLEVGDQVMTGAGLYGTLTALDDDLAWVEISPGVVVKMARRAVAAKIEPAATTSESATADGSVPVDLTADEGPGEPAEPAPTADQPEPTQPRDIGRRAS
jgi:preprotein translocase subunit YajC